MPCRDQTARSTWLGRRNCCLFGPALEHLAQTLHEVVSDRERDVHFAPPFGEVFTEQSVAICHACG